MIWLSLFDGHSGAQIALKELGANIDKYYAFEIDKHAIKVTQNNFPDTIQLGSVVKLRRYLEKCNIDLYERLICTSWVKNESKELALHCIDILTHGVDMISAGSPCQGFSQAGKGLNFNDPRSKLFFEFVKIKNLLNPEFFFLENVRMKKEHQDIISEHLGVRPQPINSNLVSAQNRYRLFWTNIKTKTDSKGRVVTNILEPEDKGVLLKDVLEKNVDEKYFLSEKSLNNLRIWENRNKENGNGFRLNIRGGDEKSTVLTTSPTHSSSTLIREGICVALRGRGENNEQQLELNKTSKTNCLTSVQKDNLIIEGCVKFGRTDECKEIRREHMKKGKDYSPFSKKEIKSIDIKKMNTLTTATNKDNLIMQINPCLESGGKQPYQQNRIYDPKGISPALCAGKSDLLIKENYRIRRLTPTECCALQTIPKWFNWEEISETQVYRMCGNGWTIKIIMEFFKYLPEKFFK